MRVLYYDVMTYVQEAIVLDVCFAKFQENFGQVPFLLMKHEISKLTEYS